MQQISQGQRMPLSNLIPGHALSVSVQLQIGTPNSVDVSCFGLDSRGHLSDDRYMTFYNQPTSPCSSVRRAAPGEFALQLGTLPSSIDRLVFTAAIDGPGRCARFKPALLDQRCCWPGGCHVLLQRQHVRRREGDHVGGHLSQGWAVAPRLEPARVQ